MSYNTTEEKVTTHVVRFDWAIKSLLRDKANFDILEGFLSELLKTDVKINSILESESNKKHPEDKYNRVDILAKTQNGDRIIVEVQVDGQWDYLSRALYGASKVITEYIQAGSDYKKICKVISVNIVFFNLGTGEDYLYKGTTEFKGENCHDILRLGPREIKAYGPEKTPADIFPEYYIIKINKFSNVVNNTLDEWIYLFKNSKIEPSFRAKGIASAAKKLNVLRMNEKERRAYERYEDSLRLEASMTFSSYGIGKIDGGAEVVLKALKEKFGPISPELEERIKTTRSEQLLILIEKIMRAEVLGEVFQ